MNAVGFHSGKTSPQQQARRTLPLPYPVCAAASTSGSFQQFPAVSKVLRHKWFWFAGLERATTISSGDCYFFSSGGVGQQLVITLHQPAMGTWRRRRRAALVRFGIGHRCQQLGVPRCCCGPRFINLGVAFGGVGGLRFDVERNTCLYKFQ